MAEEKTTKSEPQKAPYVKPKILTLKVDLSFASSATNFEGIMGLLDRPQLTVPAKAEAPDKANKAAAGASAAWRADSFVCFTLSSGASKRQIRKRKCS